MTESLRKRFTGCLLGLALGDSLGARFEGMPKGEYTYSCEKQLVYTDDTEMMINLTESIVSIGDVKPEDIAESFVRGLSPWRGYGSGTLKVLSLIENGTPFKDASRMVFPDGSCGNGAAMRVAPVGLLYWWDKDRLLNAVRQASIPTHVHPLGIEGAQIIAYAAGLAVRGTRREDIHEELFAIVKQEIFREKLLKIKDLLSREANRDEVLLTLGSGVLAQDSVPAALYAFLKLGDEYNAVIRFCLSLGGDTDTIAAMAGALTGDCLTEAGLPEECLQKLEGLDRIRDLSERLFELSQTLFLQKI